MNKIDNVAKHIQEADAIIIGAGSGMSNAAGMDFWYEASPLFMKYMKDFYEKYHFEGIFKGFYNRFDSQEERWAYLLKMLKMVSTIPPQNDVYDYVKTIVKDKPFHIITTNQDMLFKKFFPDERVSEIQGSWGFFQSKNTDTDKHLYPIQSYLDELIPKIENNRLAKEFMPKSEVDGSPLIPWVRGPEFLEDQKYYEEYDKANRFLGKYRNKKILFIEIGVGWMTPMFIQQPFWEMTNYLPNSFYINFNPKDALTNPAIADRSLLIQSDTEEALKQIAQQIQGGQNG
ncbi:Sir2 silent information regulator family NAD-dependent deacetylase [Limosilactobacillus coleohominis]|uniref:Sir2 silent information regulator family NAD-dependent deacetylase n=1 Tax=Limosilactobacillus coleohominis TaxID=181675 RepID=A0ABS2H0V8_9LACO|nr:Sir2 silent information regulator family NAD-dependent deacetylase [Limosilactobacillus coleohominis]MBM6941015.1 Sir2 silent information regulator family NAD-dependent deacetylase [Limosilactobacillus coleohominis]HJA24066.1 Sir2 silent information regulator family NAD-dependent deacetylase [Candidatus Limosilactobacillus intestinavium]